MKSQRLTKIIRCHLTINFCTKFHSNLSRIVAIFQSVVSMAKMPQQLDRFSSLIFKVSELYWKNEQLFYFHICVVFWWWCWGVLPNTTDTRDSLKNYFVTPYFTWGYVFRLASHKVLCVWCALSFSCVGSLLYNFIQTWFIFLELSLFLPFQRCLISLTQPMIFT